MPASSASSSLKKQASHVHSFSGTKAIWELDRGDGSTGRGVMCMPIQACRSCLACSYTTHSISYRCMGMSRAACGLCRISMTSTATGTFATARSRLPVDDREIQCVSECQLAAGRSVRNHSSWWFCLDAPPHPNLVSTALYPGQIALKGSLPACNQQ